MLHRLTDGDDHDDVDDNTAAVATWNSFSLS